jgi:peptide deformylase
VRAQTPEGETFEEDYDGFVARIIQHEMDHLEGVLLIDRMSPADKVRNKAAFEELVERYKAARQGA